ncbi:MarR family transcriptional regulator [Winogradskyella sp. DF17]|uniref:MarR family transcriptional regulator n=1 Tax=Winogradskyella pelagia TaxID=2819984 RepID=A0ABS3T5Y1_9FLAO|nr:MarR family transcriptional regulator [Winogradskyella sp. DF17]MBO3117699.1 MarR family transcriptional regulator [Winogradskyella sp. DF17]
MKELNQQLQIKADIPLPRASVINVFFTNNWMKDELLLCLKPYDLSLEQFNVMRILRGQNNNPINLQDIQNRMVTKMSNTTRLVDKLITKGFVKRTICKENRRKVEIVITKRGLETLDKLDPVFFDREKQLTQNLTTIELEQLNKLLIKLRN